MSDHEEKPAQASSSAAVNGNFIAKQTRRLLAICDQLESIDLDSYLKVGGYRGLKQALARSPQQVVAQIAAAGLRGRGGGGFPTARKWEVCRREKSAEKYLIGNCNEGGPGAYMSRFLVANNPHAIIEGLLIGAYAIGAGQGYVFIRPEYGDAVIAIKQAIAQAREKGYLGSGIMGRRFDFALDLKFSPGEFICGEETALIACIEGRRAMPTAKPPHPAQKGLWGKPTIINNAETYANIGPIMARGSDWFRELGTGQSKGTKIFAVTGNVKHSGLLEAPLGVSLRYILDDICGGMEKKTRKLKAVQVGGPTGGVIPASLCDTPVDYDPLKNLGAMLGPGGMIVMDEGVCMVEMARYFLAFSADESCGKCTPCRIGLKTIQEILTRITEGRGREGDLELLTELAEDVSWSSLCGLGRTAPNALLSSLRYFRAEYETHIRDRRCPTAGCVALRRYLVAAERCKKCGQCQPACPAAAISWQKKQVAQIDRDNCIKCGSCYEACPFGSID